MRHFNLDIFDDDTSVTPVPDCPLPEGVIFEKEITGGNTDVAVEVGQNTKTEYTFKINYGDPQGPPNVVIIDTVPAEWKVTAISDSGGGTCSAEQANKKGNNTAVRLKVE